MYSQTAFFNNKPLTIFVSYLAELLFFVYMRADKIDNNTVKDPIIKRKGGIERSFIKPIFKEAKNDSA